MEPKRPKVGLAAIVRRGDKVLLGKRKNTYGESLYACPGGHLEFGESPEQGIIREVWEETNMEVQSCKFYDLVSTVFDADNHYITLYYEVSATGNLLNKEPEKCEGWEWFLKDHLPTNVFPTLENILKNKPL